MDETMADMCMQVWGGFGGISGERGYRSCPCSET